MDRFRENLLNVWRDACRRIEIGESARIIMPHLAPALPLAQLTVQEIRVDAHVVETIALGNPDAPTHLRSTARLELTIEQMKELLAWCRKIQKLGPRATDFPSLPKSLGIGASSGRDTLIEPLGRTGATTGLLILEALDGRTFTAKHRELARALTEPFSVALENHHHLQELAALREAAEADKRSLLTRLGRQDLGETIVGGGSGLKAVLARVDLVTNSDAPVLIFGETGSGKELIARAIHNRSGRSAHPFIRVNCGAIPPDLIDSELFGHDRGAFTGAVADRQGWFERAHTGTLFLDEIGELPLAAQVRLLRVLQDGWLERVGGRRSIHVDVRIVAATHRDLPAMVADSKFREDLWYRLAVFPIIIPPLRERKDDIPDLVSHFAARAATRFGLRLVDATPAQLELLKAYPWPGNARELGTIIDRAAILGDGRRLEIEVALGITTKPIINGATTPAPQHPRDQPAQPDSHQPRNSSVLPIPASDHVLTLDEVQREHIERVLAACGGRVHGSRGCARLLGLNPNTLRSRMRKLGISTRRFR